RSKDPLTPTNSFVREWREVFTAGESVTRHMRLAGFDSCPCHLAPGIALFIESALSSPHVPNLWSCAAGFRSHAQPHNPLPVLSQRVIHRAQNRRTGNHVNLYEIAPRVIELHVAALLDLREPASNWLPAVLAVVQPAAQLVEIENVKRVVAEEVVQQEVAVQRLEPARREALSVAPPLKKYVPRVVLLGLDFDGPYGLVVGVH